MSRDTSIMFKPIRLGNLEVPNRITITAHGTKFCVNSLPTQRQADYLEERARGGVGMIVLEAMRVHPTSHPGPDILAGWKPEIVPGLKRITDAVQKHGTRMIGQILHQGCQVGTQGMRPFLPLWSASPVASARHMEIAHEMTIAEIDEVIEAHVISARHVQQAGMDGVEIHAAHGYLPQQFLSPVTNHRSDEYGGSLENRMRFLQRLIVAVRDEVGADYPLGLRISGDEFSEGGMDLPAMREVAAIIAAEGKIDYMSVSHSNYQSGASYATMVPDMHYPAAPFVHIAAGIKEVVGGLPTIAVGRIITPADAEGVLNKGQADMVGMTRAHIADPEIAGKMRDGRDDDIRLCLSCNQGCVAMTHSGQSLTCVVNPAVGLEAEFGREAIRTADKSKRVIVVGGGPAGMEAACVAAGRGHDVVLLEKDTALGGQFNLAVKQPGRSDLGRLTAHLTHQLEKLEVDVRLGANATAESILELKPDAVIIATGSSPAPITIPAEDSGIKTASVADILNGTVQPGERVLLLDNDGHFKAAATSQLLADQGLEVFHVTPRGTLGPEIPGISQHGVNKRLRDKKVDVRVSTGVRRIAKNDAVVFNTYSGVEETIPNIDTIVVAAAGVANNALHKALIGKVESLHIAGDAMAPRRALEAMSEGHRAGNAV